MSLCTWVRFEVDRQLRILPGRLDHCWRDDHSRDWVPAGDVYGYMMEGATGGQGQAFVDLFTCSERKAIFQRVVHTMIREGLVVAQEPLPPDFLLYVPCLIRQVSLLEAIAEAARD